MRLTLSVAAASLAVAPAFAHASFYDPNELGISCSSTLSVVSGDRLTLRCNDGVLRLEGKTEGAKLAATKSITLDGLFVLVDNLSLIAPQININADALASLATSVKVYNGELRDGAPPPILKVHQGWWDWQPALTPVSGGSSGSVLTMGGTGAVPEPSTWALALAGLASSFIARRPRRD